MLGEEIIAYDVLDSTNEFMKREWKKLHDGAVVITLEQTEGKGRMGRKWISPKGGLWFSTLFKPRKIFDPNFYTKLFSVSIVQVLDDVGVKVEIKWPNDIYVWNKKLGGILTETILTEYSIDAVIVGVGINVNNEIPDEIKEKAVNLQELTGKKWDIIPLMKRILSKVWKNINKYRKKPEALTKIWKGFLTIKEGSNIDIKIEGFTKKAKVVKILPDRLTVEIEGRKKDIFSLDYLY
ncbi:MAG TPA: biotin--[acetyl-CoA-carboxylase] ligase [Thermotoga sp.]|nr:biotin--[acetyl-CoA-carboxylase] ligase [Thermotoga sp.]